MLQESTYGWPSILRGHDGLFHLNDAAAVLLRFTSDDAHR